VTRSKRMFTEQEVYDLVEQARDEARSAAFEEAAGVVADTNDYDVAGERCSETVQYIARRIRCIGAKVPFS
jgi:hypothetical protein